MLKGLPFGLILEPRTAEELKKHLAPGAKREEHSTDSYETYDEDKKSDTSDDDDDEVSY